MTGRTILALAAALATATGGAAIAQQQQQQPWMQGGQRAPFEARAGSPGENDERMRERLERAGFQRPRIVAVGVIEAMGPDGETIVFRIAEPAERRQAGMGQGMGPGMRQGMGMQPGMQQPGMGPMGTPGMQRPGAGPEMGGPGAGMGPGMGQGMGPGMMAGQDRERAQQDQRRTENLLADALEMAGYTRFERIAPAHLQASAPDGRTVTIVFDGGMFGQGQGQAMARQMQERQMQQMHGQMQGQMQGQQQQQRGPGMPQATGAFDPRGLQAAPRPGAQPGGLQMWRDEAVVQPLLNRSQVRRIIEVHGLTEVSDIELVGDTFQATAQLDGEEVEVVVDARTGNVIAPQLDPERPEVDVDVDDAIDTEAVEDETDEAQEAEEDENNGG